MADRYRSINRWQQAVGIALATISAMAIAVWLISPAPEAVGQVLKRVLPTPRPLVPGATAAVNGITIRIERIESTPDGVLVHLTATDLEGGVVSTVSARGLPEDALRSSTPGSGWDLRLPRSARTLTIDSIAVTRSESTTIDLDIPATGSIDINRVVTLGLRPLLLKSGSWVDDPANGRVFRIDFHSDVVAGRRLSTWNLDGVGSSVIETTTTAGDGVIELFPDQPHGPPPGPATVRFSQPQLSVDGPWMLRIE